MNDPTMCDICNKPIDGSWVVIHDAKTNKHIESRCSPCDDKKRREQFQKDHRISTQLLMKATLNQAYKKLEEGDQEVLDAYALLLPEVKRFQEAIWFGGMQDIARNAKVKGTSVADGDFKILCYTMCGRAMVTLDSPTASLTLITQEDAPPVDKHGRQAGMGVQGIDATGPEAFALLERAQKLWATGARTTEDREIRIAGT